VDSDLEKMHKSEHILSFLRIGRFVGENGSKVSELQNGCFDRRWSSLVVVDHIDIASFSIWV